MPDAPLALAVGVQQRKLQVGLLVVGQALAVAELDGDAGVGVHGRQVQVGEGAPVVGAQVPFNHQALTRSQPADCLPTLPATPSARRIECLSGQGCWIPDAST